MSEVARVPALSWATLLAVAVGLPAYGQGGTVALAEHEKAIAERDQVIRALKQRIESLEHSGRSASKPEADTRALERSLLREGGLVLPPKAFEVEPHLTYTHRSGPKGQAFRREEAEASVTLKTGLPWRTQIELSVPYAYAKAHPEGQAGAAPTMSASGRGDLSVALTHQLLDERSGRPAVLGTVRWTHAGSAASDSEPVPLRSGFRTLQGALTLVKRKDPAVFFGGIGYTGGFSRRIEGTLVEPGGIASVRVGSVIALRPDTSMTVGLELDRTRTAKADGAGVPDSRTSQGLLQIGFGYLISPRLLLDVQANVGLTPHSPDYRLSVSLPYRF